MVGAAHVRREIEGTAACLLHLDRSIAVAPTDARLWFARGLIRATGGKYEQPLGDFDTAISLAPGRARALSKLGNYVAATAAMTNAIDLEPSDEHHAWRDRLRSRLP